MKINSRDSVFFINNKSKALALIAELYGDSVKKVRKYDKDIWEVEGSTVAVGDIDGEGDYTMTVYRPFKSTVDEGWKDVAVAGALAATAAATIIASPPTYVNSQRHELALADAPKDAKTVTDDKGNKVKVWMSTTGKANNRIKLYKPVKESTSTIAQFIKLIPRGTVEENATKFVAQPVKEIFDVEEGKDKLFFDKESNWQTALRKVKYNNFSDDKCEARRDGKVVARWDAKTSKGWIIKEGTGLSPKLLADYKKAASADASMLDQKSAYLARQGNKYGAKVSTEKANKRFRGITKATMKQFDNDDKGIKEAETKKYVMTHANNCPWNYGHDCECGKKTPTHNSSCGYIYGHDCDCGLDELKGKNKLYDLDEATHKVPAGTFTPLTVKEPGMSKSDPKYDWRNPNHNPSGEKPSSSGHKVSGKYNPDNYPVLDDEHGTHLFDPDFVNHMREVYKDWDNMSELEQIKSQVSFIQPMPGKDFDLNKDQAKVTVLAKKLQAAIKR